MIAFEVEVVFMPENRCLNFHRQMQRLVLVILTPHLYN
jgi:hypothetical protein